MTEPQFLIKQTLFNYPKTFEERLYHVVSWIILFYAKNICCKHSNATNVTMRITVAYGASMCYNVFLVTQ